MNNFNRTLRRSVVKRCGDLDFRPLEACSSLADVHINTDSPGRIRLEEQFE